jgi:tight adherence protein B
MIVALVVGLVVAAVVLWPERVGRASVPPDGLVARDAVGARGRGGPLAVVGGKPLSPWRSRARAMDLEAALAELVAALAAPLRTGVAPSVALVAAEPVCGADPALGPLLRDLVEATRRGNSPAEVWLRHAHARGSADLRFMGQAWALSERTGAPLADALVTGEEVLRARARGRERLAGAAAGPRASMAVLCLLPASGPVVGAAMGVDPQTLYLSSPLATGSLVLGLVLAAGAWCWSRRILGRAT